MTRHRELVALTNKENILRLNTEGYSIYEIVTELGLSEATVRKHMREAIDEYKDKVDDLSSQIIAKNLVRSEMIIERLMKEAFRDPSATDLSRIDRIKEMMLLQVKIAAKEKPIKVTHEGNVDNPIRIAPLFRYGGEDYERALALAQEDPTLLIINPEDEKMAQYLAELEESALAELEEMDIEEAIYDLGEST